PAPATASSRASATTAATAIDGRPALRPRAQPGDEASLRPMMPATISARLSTRPRFAGSPNSTMPRIAVPTAPTPTQTAYAVPTGSDFIAIPSRNRLTAIAPAVPSVGHRRVNPSVYLSPIAQP